MSDTTTIARPYAKALFEHALNAKQLLLWSEILNNLAMSVLDENAMKVIASPTVTEKEQVELFMSLFSKLNGEEAKAIENFIALLAYNKRLGLLPDIKILFEALRSEQEKTLNVKVLSFSELSSAQQQQLIDSLSKRLQRQVTLSVSVDKSLLGGALIQAGDLVIDGSVRGKLNKLSTSLAA